MAEKSFGIKQINMIGVGTPAIESSDDLIIKTNGSERVRILSGGNVGIGSTDPEHTLVVGDTVALARLRIRNYDDSAGRYASLNFKTENGGENGDWSIYNERSTDAANSYLKIFKGNGTGTHMYFKDPNEVGIRSAFYHVDANGADQGDSCFGFVENTANPGFKVKSGGTERLRIHTAGHGEFSSGAITRVLLSDDVSTTSGTSITFPSSGSIPSWATKITLLFDRVSTTGGSELLVQLGTSSGAITSGYDSSSSNSSGATLESSTAGFVIYVNAAASELTGKMEIQRAGTSKGWISAHTMKSSTNTRDGAGVLTTHSGTIDRVVVATEGGSNTFDGGAITVYYEA